MRKALAEREKPTTSAVGVSHMRAIQGDKEAMKHVKEHLKDDLQALAEVYKKLKPLIHGA